MPFVGKVTLEPIREAGSFSGGKWKVISPLIFKSKRHDAIISVPEGFVTDLASVPRLLILAYALAGGTAVKAAVIHDWIYEHPAYLDDERQMLPRHICDDIFDEINEIEGVPGWRATLMWTALRAVGWLTYGEKEEG